jgi:hypothetical protein
MAPIRQLGVSPSELDDLVAEDRWRQWCVAEPVLNELAGLHELRAMRGEQEDRILGALVRLASRAGGDDRLAAVAVIHQLGGSIRTIAKRFWRMTDEDIEEIVTASMWEEVRSFDWRRRTEHFGASLTYATRRSVRRTLTSGHSRYVDGVVVPVDPQTWFFDALRERAAALQTPADQIDSRMELERFLAWALERRHLSTDDVKLLLTLVSADRNNPEIPRWLRGACSMAAVAQVAEQRGVCAKSVTRARNRVLDQLRQVAPAYIEEVA